MFRVLVFGCEGVRGVSVLKCSGVWVFGCLGAWVLGCLGVRVMTFRKIKRVTKEGPKNGQNFG